MDRLPRYTVEAMTLDEARARHREVSEHRTALWVQIEPIMPAYHEHEDLGEEVALLSQHIGKIERQARGTEPATAARVRGFLKRNKLYKSYMRSGPEAGFDVYGAFPGAHLTEKGAVTDATRAEVERLLTAEGFTFVRNGVTALKVVEQKIKAVTA